MAAVIIPDTVLIKRCVMFSKLKAQRSVQTPCNKKCGNGAAAGALPCDV